MAFEKYAESGSYHWQMTYAPSFRRRSPRAHALYDIPLNLLSGALSLNGSRGLDLGCGDGVMLYKLWQTGCTVTGLDSSQDGLDLARRELDKRGAVSVKLVQGSCLSVPLPSNSFDFVSAIEVIEHLDDVDAFLKEVTRLLRPGGVFVCTTPNRLPTQAPTAVRDPYHVREYIGPELRAALQPHFHDVSVYGGFPAWLDSPYSANTTTLLHKGLRFGVKMLSLAWNPFVGLLRQNPSQKWNGLAALARRAESEHDTRERT